MLYVTYYMCLRFPIIYGQPIWSTKNLFGRNLYGQKFYRSKIYLIKIYVVKNLVGQKFIMSKFMWSKIHWISQKCLCVLIIYLAPVILPDQGAAT